MFILECHSILICETGTFPSAQRHASGCHTGRELAQEPGANKGYFGSKRLFSPGSRRGKVLAAPFLKDQALTTEIMPDP